MTERCAIDAASSIRNGVLRGLARDRTPGWSFTGHFLGMQWPVIGADSMTVTMPAGPHCEDAQGQLDPCALLVLFDAALASPTRIHLTPGARIATTHINVQFSGAQAAKEVQVQAQNEGRSQEGAMRQLLAHGKLESGGQMVMTGNGSFVQLPPPADVREMAPLPWQRTDLVDPQPLAEDALDAREREVLAACDAALAASGTDAQYSFLQRFWGILPERTAKGAQCRMPIGPHLANRVGHVQGGILMGLAAETARCAVPLHRSVANLSAWFAGPGRGDTLLAKSWVVHGGRSLAIVRTEITGANGARVLEATSAHAA